MNMTKSAFLVAKSFRETVLPDTTSGNLKSTAVVPSGSMVDGVSDMVIPPLMLVCQNSHPVRTVGPCQAKQRVRSFGTAKRRIEERFWSIPVKGVRKDADYARTHYRYKAKRRPFSHAFRLA